MMGGVFLILLGAVCVPGIFWPRFRANWKGGTPLSAVGAAGFTIQFIGFGLIKLQGQARPEFVLLVVAGLLCIAISFVWDFWVKKR